MIKYIKHNEFSMTKKSKSIGETKESIAVIKDKIAYYKKHGNMPKLALYKAKLSDASQALVLLESLKIASEVNK